jgi:gliding motility-associated-like protein
LVCALLSFWVGAQSFEYIQNKGQWHPDVLFKGELATGAFFLKQNGYRVLQHNQDDFIRATEIITGHAAHEGGESKMAAGKMAAPGGEPDIWVRSHAYDVQFDGSNPLAEIIHERQSPGYSNFIIGNDPSKWTSYVASYGSVMYKNVYPGIDVRYFSENGFLKYDIIVHPGASPDRIVLRYEGVDGLSVNNGDLIVKTSVSEVKEQYPYSYQVINGLRQQIKARFEVDGNKVRFKLGGYDRSKTLVIDPTLIFSSFTGSPSDNWGYTATYDEAGALYAGGIVFGNRYPVTPGAFQTQWAGGNIQTGENGSFDMGIMKFSSNGTQRIYATYIGGAVSNEQPHSLIVDAAGELIIAGRTRSTDYPITGSAIGTGGLWDIVVTKLNVNGTGLIGSKRIGGTKDDGVNIKHKYEGTVGPSSLAQNYGDDARSEVMINSAGDVMVATCTQSNNFPITFNAFQSTLRGGQDGLILKFDPTIATLQFASYLGGSGDDAAYVVAIGNGGDLFVGGGTGSIDFPGDKTGVVQANNLGGICDGFVARLSPDGTTLLKSTYIGTNGNDQVYGVQFDRLGMFYIMGTSTGNFPVRNAPFSQNGGKQYIAKLQPDFSQYVYSTVFGTNSTVPNLSPTAFLVDRCENVYMSGWGGRVVNANPPFPNSGTTGLTITPDAFQSQTDGKDFYFFVLERDATRQLFGSFFGQQDPPTVNSADHVDGGTSRFDRNGIIYQGICANCGGGQFPTTPGVVGPTNPSGRCNQAVIKVSLDLAGVRGKVKAAINNVDGDTIACVPVTVNFRDSVGLAKSYEWNFGDGTPTQITNTPSVSHSFSVIGSFKVRMIAVDSSLCYIRDTSFITISVREDSVALRVQAVKQPPCQSNTYLFNNLSFNASGKPFNTRSFTWYFGDNSAPITTDNRSVTHSYPGPGTYNVKLVLNDTNFCNAPDSLVIQLRVSPNVEARFTTPPDGCAPYQAQFTNTSMGGTDFFWSFGDGTTSRQVSPTKLYTTPGTYTVKLVAVDTNTCNLIDSTQSTIIVSDKPTAAFTFSPNPPEENIITTFTNNSTGAVRYKWLFGDGDSLITIRRDTIVKHQYPQTGSYNACLIAINQYDCPDTTCREVAVIINPLLDVVNAFTPNGDGVNDRAVAIGYGIAKMTFRIYNRWGQLMFESNDISLGWDGKFNGKPQPMDAYAYTLDAALVDGTPVRKAGSITLVR